MRLGRDSTGWRSPGLKAPPPVLQRPAISTANASSCPQRADKNDQIAVASSGEFISSPQPEKIYGRKVEGSPDGKSVGSLDFTDEEVAQLGGWDGVRAYVERTGRDLPEGTWHSGGYASSASVGVGGSGGHVGGNFDEKAEGSSVWIIGSAMERRDNLDLKAVASPGSVWFPSGIVDELGGPVKVADLVGRLKADAPAKNSPCARCGKHIGAWMCAGWTGGRSCPSPWCRSDAPWRVGPPCQAAMAGRLTMGLSLKGAMVSRLI
jgi:hypothetical protein